MSCIGTSSVLSCPHFDPSLKVEICEVVDLCMSIGFDCFESCWWSSCVIILVIIDSCHIENVFHNKSNDIFSPIISDDNIWQLKKNTAGAWWSYITPRYMHVLYHMNAHIHPRPAAGTRSKGPSHGAKLWARATIGSTNLQAAGCYRYMLSSLLGETPYIFIYTQFVHHFLRRFWICCMYRTSALHC